MTVELILGDCLQVMRGMADKSVDAVITDPPYGINYQPDWKKWDGTKSNFKPIYGDDKPFDPTPFLNYETVVMFGEITILINCQLVDGLYGIKHLGNMMQNNHTLN